MRSTPIFFLLGATLLHCAALTPYPENTCGNRVVDAKEDCDDRTDPSCVACRYRCDVALDGGATTQCNTSGGWACGVDGICRRKSGSLALAGAPVSSNVITLKAGDFDADKRVDVLGSPKYGSAGTSRVHYFDSKGALSSITQIDLSIAIPIVADLDHQGGLDIGFAARNLPLGGFGALAGQTDRTFSTIVFPSKTSPGTDVSFAVINANPSLGVRLPAGLPGCAVGLRSAVDKGVTTYSFGNVCVEAPAGALNPPNVGGTAPAGLTIPLLLDRPRTGRFFDPKDPSYSACGEIAFTTAEALYIMSPCTPGLDGNVAWRADAPVVRVPLTGKLAQTGDTIFTGPVSRLDQDEVVVHYDKLVDAREFWLLDRTDHTFKPDETFSPGTGLPLASGDLDGDGIPDFVLSSAIKLSTPDPLRAGPDAGASKPPARVSDWTHQVAVRDQLRWTEARIGRFNNDDLPDVLVSFTSALDVDVMRNSGGGTFTPFTVRSNQRVQQIASGDFDGDRIDDIAFLESATTLDTGDEATLTLAFGSAEGGPDTPRTAGKFKNVRGFDALRGSGGTANLAVVQVTPVKDQPPNTSISVLFGNGGRVPVAPLFLSDATDLARRWEPVSFNIGKFPNRDTSAIIAISTGFLSHDDPKGGAGQVPFDFHTRPWLATPDPTAVGGFAPFFLVGDDLTKIAGLDQEAFALGRRQLQLITASGDIDVPPDGTDELVNMAPAPLQPDVVNVVIVHTQAASSGDNLTQIQNARVDEGDPIEVFDLDGDGYKDIVYIITVGGKRALSVLLGDKKGGFNTTPITTAGSAIEDAIGFAMIDTGDGTQAAVVTSRQLWLVRLANEHFSYTNASSVLGPTADGITAVTSGDFNGDGVPDLAIAQSGGIRVILQKPVNE